MICGSCSKSFSVYPGDEYAPDGAVCFCWRCSGISGPEKKNGWNRESYTYQYPCVEHPTGRHRAFVVNSENMWTCDCGTFNKGRLWCFTCGALHPRYGKSGQRERDDGQEDNG